MLHRANLVVPLTLDDRVHGLTEDHLLLIGLGADQSSLSPLEVLQAYEPRGIACYFTALMVHDLVTQPVAQHHVAVLRKSPSIVVDDFPASAPPTAKRAPPLGDWQFTWQGVPYFRTSRDRRYLVATQWQELSALSRFQVTTFEQTLIDTLHRPMSCGGPAVVFEAWDGAIDRLNASQLIAHVRTIGDQRLTRRVGFMLERAKINEAEQLYLAHQSGSGSEDQPISLLTGISFSKLSVRWQVYGP